jgi:hypothetical protein
MSRLQELLSLHELHPDDPFIIYALAREYEFGMATMQALLMYEHLVTAHPTYMGTYYHYANLLYHAGNRNEARRLLEKGIATGVGEKDFHAVSEMKNLFNTWFGDDDD